MARREHVRRPSRGRCGISASAPSLPPPNTAPFTLQQIVDATGGRLVRGDSAAEVRGVATDTRMIAPTLAAAHALRAPRAGGPLFIALCGANFDGHELAQQAVDAGASALLVERELDTDAPQVLVDDTKLALGDLANFHRRRCDALVVAVTGSYGKTTTRAMIAAVLSPLFKVLSSDGNFNNEIGLPLTLLRLDQSHGAAVLELGMRGPGQIEYLTQVAEPVTGVVTNVGPQHIELLGSLDAIARAKGELFDSMQQNGVCILPHAGEGVEVLRSMARWRPTRTFGFASSTDALTADGVPADVRVLSAEPDGRGGTACVFEFGQLANAPRIAVRLPLPGAHNALNAAAALCLVHDIRGAVSLEAAVRALESVEVPGARMKLRVLEEKEITIIDDCYNAGPDSMRAALQVLGEMPNASRRVAILGAMKELGDWSDGEHRKIGVLTAQTAQVLVGVGEETKAMLEAAGDVEKHWCADAEAAAELSQVLAARGDVILVKGSRSVGLERVVSALVG